MSAAASAWFATAPMPDGTVASDSEAERLRGDAAEAVVAAELANGDGSSTEDLQLGRNKINIVK